MSFGGFGGGGLQQQQQQTPQMGGFGAPSPSAGQQQTQQHIDKAAAKDIPKASENKNTPKINANEIKGEQMHKQNRII